MEQLSMPFAEKLDEPLAAMCNRLAPSARVAVVIRCELEAMPAVAQQVIELGGKIRRQVAFLGLIAAWLPLVSIAKLVTTETVHAVELEHSFTIA